MEDLSKLSLEHKNILDAYIEMSKIDPDDTITKAYSFIKQVASTYYRNSKMDTNYTTLLSYLMHLEYKCLGSKNMLKFSRKMPTTKCSDEKNVLDSIVWNTRKHLMGYGARGIVDLYDWNFQYKCVEASNYIHQLCQDNGLKCQVVTIYPGYDSSACINYFDILRHCFNIIKYNSKYYLLDITYAQFFDNNVNHIGRLGVPLFDGPSVGCYMLLTEKGRNIAYKILTDGYIELTEDVFKTYMDSFTLSFRNGLFYEKNDSSFCVPYSIDDYEKFLAGFDSQVKHEGVKCLGRQKRPLRNPNIDFKIKQYM